MTQHVCFSKENFNDVLCLVIFSNLHLLVQ